MVSKRRKGRSFVVCPGDKNAEMTAVTGLYPWTPGSAGSPKSP